MTKLSYIVTFKNGSTVEMRTLAEAREAGGVSYTTKYTKIVEQKKGNEK